mmetsp:Transcript_35987/g.94682  ORF Transcript_35987/g.94682 Transcript_35987/m.94682 type:complete len:82 (-) Transcript_35987:790-1035(-)
MHKSAMRDTPTRHAVLKKHKLKGQKREALAIRAAVPSRCDCSTERCSAAVVDVLTRNARPAPCAPPSTAPPAVAAAGALEA